MAVCIEGFRMMTVHVVTLPKIPVTNITRYAIVSGITIFMGKYLGPSTLARYSASVRLFRSQSFQNSCRSLLNSSIMTIPLGRDESSGSVKRNRPGKALNVRRAFGKGCQEGARLFVNILLQMRADSSLTTVYFKNL